MVAPDRWAANTEPVVHALCKAAVRHGTALVLGSSRGETRSRGFRWEIPRAARISFHTAPASICLPGVSLLSHGTCCESMRTLGFAAVQSFLHSIFTDPF